MVSHPAEAVGLCYTYWVLYRPRSTGLTEDDGEEQGGGDGRLAVEHDG